MRKIAFRSTDDITESHAIDDDAKGGHWIYFLYVRNRHHWGILPAPSPLLFILSAFCCLNLFDLPIFWPVVVVYSAIICFYSAASEYYSLNYLPSNGYLAIKLIHFAS